MMEEKSIGLKKIDSIYAFCISVLFLVAIVSPYIKTINYAYVNLIFSIIPSIYIISKFRKIRYKYGILLLFFLMSLIKTINLIVNIKYLNGYEVINDFGYMISFIINSISFSLLCKYVHSSENCNSDFDLIKTCKCIVFWIIIYSAYNVFTNFSNFTSIFNTYDVYKVNFSSFFNNRNNFSLILLIGIITLQYLFEKKIIKKYNFIVILAFFIFNLIVTLSRTAIISVLLFYIIYIFFDNKKKNRKLFVFLGILLIILTFAFVPNLLELLNKFIIRKEYGLTSRTVIWQYARGLVKDTIILGLGETRAASTIQALSGNSYFHNFILKTIICDGLVFCIGLLTFLIWCFRTLFKMEKKNLFFAIQVSILAYGFTEHFDLFSFGLMSVCMTLLYLYIPLMRKVRRNEK